MSIWGIRRFQRHDDDMQLNGKVAATMAVLFLCLFTVDVYLNYRPISVSGNPAAESVAVSPADLQLNLPQRQPDTGEVTSADVGSDLQIESHANKQLLAIVKQRSIFYALGFLLGLILFSWLLNKKLLFPISHLKQVAKELARGNYLAAANLPEHDQLSHVSQAFKSMAEEIAKREELVNRQKALYAALSQTSKMILRNRSPRVLFERVCDIAVTFGGFNAAWIGEVNEIGKNIVPIASAGINLESLKACTFELDLTNPKADSPLAISAYGKCPSVIDEIDVDPGKTPWHRLAQLSGSRSAAVFPIVTNQLVVATLTVYAQERHYFTLTIHDLLDEMVKDLAFAIENYERTQAHKVAHKSLEKSSGQLEAVNKKMSLILESTGEGIFGIDERDACTFINKAAAEMLGYPQDELLNQQIHKRVRMFDEAGKSFNSAVLQRGESVRIKDESFLRKNETLFPVEYSTYPIKEEGRFKGSVTVFRDVTSTRSMMREMRFLATHDSLTHLLNRHAFDQRLRQAFANCRDHGMQHVLLYMDLDQFKLVNDTCGHVAGDMMLRQLSHRLQRTIGGDDVLARLGGDEFGLLMENCQLDRAQRLATKICSVVKDFRFTWEGRTFSTGVSIGIVAIGPNTESPHSALSSADAACYVAKDMGRNRIHVFQPYDEEIKRQQGEMRWVGRIESAMDQQRFSLLQQPIMSLRSSAIGDEHIEVLLRMQDERGKQIMPGAFIPAAERYNVMGSLDRWVISHAFRWLSENPQRLDELGLCAINLSGQSLGDGSLHEHILEQLRKFNLPAEKISFEITETAVVSRLDQAARFISLLKRRGFRFALDDFGTGMSSFSYLKRLPVDYLKIDGSFVSNMVNDPVDKAMVESINEIGHLMGLQTIAEYVEDDQTLEQLIDIGVDYAQGFGVVRPMPLQMAGSGPLNAA
ncbi:MAG: EAL domain-containing protein [Candidatus Thiodiazotropha sp. (ex Clathrolucina costata)]|nr:EAL domain-containing protein [Candidatus Thiodiazotropha taylori]MCG7863039.1 EAL domain-containing protein [Candidatus Thiodiazotropha endolucinida]